MTSPGYGFSKWIQELKKCNQLSAKRARELVESDFKKFERLQQISSEFNIPVYSMFPFSANDFLNESEKLKSFFEKSNSPIYFVKAEPLPELAKTQPIIERRFKLSQMETIEFVKNLKPYPSAYAIYVLPWVEPKWSGSFMVVKKGIICELTQGDHYYLAQGIAAQEHPLYYFFFDFEKNQGPGKEKELQIKMEQAIKWVKIGSSKNHKTVNGYLQGYFEFLIYSNNELKFLDYNPYFMGSEIPVMNSIAQGIVHGQPAHVGIVTGIARIVRNASELHKIQKGDILVTGMTTPEFIPVFDKIKGIITDTGGILCHAAIISREIGIPCIVGTENATRVLKNGQKIEVDATQGIVQILENKKA